MLLRDRGEGCWGWCSSPLRAGAEGVTPPPRCFGASLSPQLCSYRHCEASRGLFEAPDVKTRREWEGKHDGHKERRHLGPRHCGLLVKAGEPLHPSQGSVPYPSGRVGTTSWLKRGWRGHSTPKRGEGYTRGGQARGTSAGAANGAALVLLWDTQRHRQVTTSPCCMDTGPGEPGTRRFHLPVCPARASSGCP